MPNRLPAAAKIHEFSTGIYIEWLSVQRWRSTGFTGAWNNNTFGNTYGQVGIPPALDAAIRNKEFDVRAQQGEVAVVGRVVQRQGDPHVWAVVAVVSNAVDTRGRGFPVWRYFCCDRADQHTANLEVIRLLGLLDKYHATYCDLPQFDPRSLSDQPVGIGQLQPAPRPQNESKSPIYEDALDKTTTVILPLAFDAGTCSSYHQLVALAATVARDQRRLMSWAWNVSEVEQPGAFVAIQMAAGYKLRMRQAAAPVVEGADVAGLGSVLQEFGRNKQVKAETIDKLDQLLAQDPRLKDREILRQIFQSLNVEANKGFFLLDHKSIIRLEQVRLLTLWPLLDPQMWREYLKWCRTFPRSTPQGKMSQLFQQELKALLPQFPDLQRAVGAEVVEIGWELLKARKISGTELAQQLTDPDSLFAPDPNVLFHILGDLLYPVKKECDQLIQGKSLASDAELVQDPYWAELKTYLSSWLNQDASRLLALGVSHTFFLGSQTARTRGDGLLSRDWKSFFDLSEGWSKAGQAWQWRTRLEKACNDLPNPASCYEKYGELVTFLDALCQQQYGSTCKPLNGFLKAALQPVTISVSQFGLVLKAIGYVIKPILGCLALGIVTIPVLSLIIDFVRTAIIPLLNSVVAFVVVSLLILFVIVVIASIWPERMTTVQGSSGRFSGSSGRFSEGLRSRTEALLNTLRSLPDSNEKKQWNSFLKTYTGFLIDVLDLNKIHHIKRNEHLRDIAQCIQTEIKYCKQEFTQAVGKQAWDTVESKHRVLVRLQCFAVWTLTLDPSDTPINPVDDFLTELAHKNVWNLDKSIPEQAELVEDLNQITINEIVNFSAQLRQSLANEDKGSRCLSKLDLYLTAHLFTGLLENRITTDIFPQWVGSDKFIPPEALLKVLQHDRNLYLDVNYCHHSRIWNPLCIRYNPQASMSSDDISKRGYGLIGQVLFFLSQETSQDTLVSDKLSALAEVFNQVCTIPSSAVYETLRRIVTKRSSSQYQEQDLAQKLETALSNLPSVPPVSPVSPKRSSVGTPSTKTQPPTQAQTSNGKIPWKMLVLALSAFILALVLSVKLPRNIGTAPPQTPSPAPTETSTKTISWGEFFGSFIPEPQPSASTSPNRETFLKIKEDLQILTLGADDATLAEKIAQQLGEKPKEADANTPLIQDSLLQLWSNPDDPDSWSQDNQDVLSEGVKALQKDSGLEDAKVTGILTHMDPLYRLIKRRTSRDVVIGGSEANQQVLTATPNLELRLKTAGSLEILINDIAKDCKKKNKSQVIDALKKELTGNPDSNALNWTELDSSAMKDFETAIVLYKYPIKSRSGSFSDPLPTLIKGQDDPDLYDLELGIRQQIKCWDGLSDPPPDP